MVRLPLGKTPTDIFSYLLKEDRVTKRKYTQKEPNIECVALVIGGMPILLSVIGKRCYAKSIRRFRYYVEHFSVSEPPSISTPGLILS